jgi:hypothetical protein
MSAIIALLGAVVPAVSFEGLTIAQWATIASTLYTAEPEIKAAIVALHPAFKAVAADLDSGMSTDDAAQAAAQRHPAPTSSFNPAAPR